MSEATRHRIEVLQHRRRQTAARARLEDISRRLGEPVPASVDAERSLVLQHAMSDRLRELRAAGRVHVQRFVAAADAVAAFLASPAASAGELLWEIYGSTESGFFTGLPSPTFCGECLDRGFEGFALVGGDAASGALLDKVEDDPVFGSFYEVESW
jgi:hypothetical protein